MTCLERPLSACISGDRSEEVLLYTNFSSFEAGDLSRLIESFAIQIYTYHIYSDKRPYSSEHENKIM